MERRKVWLTLTTRVLSSNAAKTRNPLKLAEVPQTRQQISTVSRPKFAILRGRVEEVGLSIFNMLLFSDCRYMPQLRRYSPTKLCHGALMAIFCVLYVFPASRVQHISDNTCILNSHYLVSWLEFNVPFQHKHGYIRDERSQFIEDTVEPSVFLPGIISLVIMCIRIICREVRIT